jgi:cytochrome c2
MKLAGYAGRLSLAWILTVGCNAAMSTAALADDAEAGRELYVQTCSKCHGLLTEDKLSWRHENFFVKVVTLPLGPSLSGSYLRPAGIMEGYKYSRAFRERAAANGWVWDDAALEIWLASSQVFIRGSTMFLKVDQPDRGNIIAYLKKYARYKPQ